MFDFVLTRCAADTWLCLQFRCMEHSLHLGAGHFVRGVAPTLSREILIKAQHEDLDGTATGDNSEDEFEAADSIGKALVSKTRLERPLSDRAPRGL